MVSTNVCVKQAVFPALRWSSRSQLAREIRLRGTNQWEQTW